MGPRGRLTIDRAGDLYGATSFGGKCPGDGTVFKLTVRDHNSQVTYCPRHIQISNLICLFCLNMLER